MAGAVAADALERGPVPLGHRNGAVQGKAAVVVPAEHVGCIAGIKTVCAHQIAGHASADGFVQSADGRRIQRIDPVVEGQPALVVERVDTVGDDEVAMRVNVERGADLTGNGEAPAMKSGKAVRMRS